MRLNMLGKPIGAAHTLVYPKQVTHGPIGEEVSEQSRGTCTYLRCLGWCGFAFGVVRVKSQSGTELGGTRYMQTGMPISFILKSFAELNRNFLGGTG